VLRSPSSTNKSTRDYGSSGSSAFVQPHSLCSSSPMAFVLAHLPYVERCRYIGARSCLRGVILRMLSSRKEMVDAIDSAVAAEGWKIVMYLRLSPVVCCQSAPGSGCGGVPAPRPLPTLPTTTRLLPFCMPAAKDASPPPCSVPKVPICCLPSSAASTLT